jgi:hypothetical protein
MNRVVIASELLKLAREMTADSGDVPFTFNIDAYFESAGGGMMTSQQASAAQKILSDAMDSVYDKVNNLLEKEIASPKNQKLIKSIGLKLK